MSKNCFLVICLACITTCSLFYVNAGVNGFILPDGEVTICEQLYWNPNFIIGNVNENSISEIWNSPKSLALANMKIDNIQEKSRCRTCTLFQDCFDNRNRCWVDIIKAYGEENWDYPDPRCNKAPKMIFDLSFNTKKEAIMV